FRTERRDGPASLDRTKGPDLASGRDFPHPHKIVFRHGDHSASVATERRIEKSFPSQPCQLAAVIRVAHRYIAIDTGYQKGTVRAEGHVFGRICLEIRDAFGRSDVPQATNVRDAFGASIDVHVEDELGPVRACKNLQIARTMRRDGV